MSESKKIKINQVQVLEDVLKGAKKRLMAKHQEKDQDQLMNLENKLSSL